MIKKFDFLVIGSGIAGMSYALKVAKKGTVALICKSELEEANTYFAQGGIASVTNNLVDNFEKHEVDVYEFYNLGIGDPYPISATEKTGLGDMLDEVVNKTLTATINEINKELGETSIIRRIRGLTIVKEPEIHKANISKNAYNQLEELVPEDYFLESGE